MNVFENNLNQSNDAVFKCLSSDFKSTKNGLPGVNFIYLPGTNINSNGIYGPANLSEIYNSVVLASALPVNIDDISKKENSQISKGSTIQVKNGKIRSNGKVMSTSNNSKSTSSNPVSTNIPNANIGNYLHNFNFPMLTSLLISTAAITNPVVNPNIHNYKKISDIVQKVQQYTTLFSLSNLFKYMDESNYVTSSNSNNNNNNNNLTAIQSFKLSTNAYNVLNSVQRSQVLVLLGQINQYLISQKISLTLSQFLQVQNANETNSTLSFYKSLTAVQQNAVKNATIYINSNFILSNYQMCQMLDTEGNFNYNFVYSASLNSNLLGQVCTILAEVINEKQVKKYGDLLLSYQTIPQPHSNNGSLLFLYNHYYQKAMNSYTDWIVDCDIGQFAFVYNNVQIAIAALLPFSAPPLSPNIPSEVLILPGSTSGKPVVPGNPVITTLLNNLINVLGTLPQVLIFSSNSNKTFEILLKKDPNYIKPIIPSSSGQASPTMIFVKYLIGILVIALVIYLFEKYLDDPVYCTKENYVNKSRFSNIENSLGV
jgi:hypothetical protein